MVAAKKVRDFKPKNDYFCIKSVIQVIEKGRYPDHRNESYFDYTLVGLGTDDKLYKYTSEGWIEL
jgi:hypothetical protein